MTVLVSALAFLILLTLLILIHEWGHYAAARRAGVEVEEFGFGLPPRITTLFRRGKTHFTLNWIPFGGFVRLKGENALTEKERTAKGSFGAASVSSRVLILLAGVIMNFLLAVILLTVGFSVGRWIPTYVSPEDMREAAERGEINLTPRVSIAGVVGGKPAARAGVPTDVILQRVDGEAVRWPDEVRELQRGKEQVTYTVARLKEDGMPAEKTQQFTVPLEEGESGIDIRLYPLDLSAPQRGIVPAFLLSMRETRVMSEQTVYGMGKLITSLASTGTVPQGITGIVGIAQLTHVSVQQGFMTYLRLVALLSLTLAILNVLPFPALDGGRLLFVLAEAVRRKPVNRRIELTTNAIGFSVLIALILTITFYDILRLF